MALNGSEVSSAAQTTTWPTTTTTTTSVVVQDGNLFPLATVAEASTFGLIWLTAVVGNGLITCTLLRRGLLTHPSNRLVFSVTLSNLIFSFCVFPCILVSAIKQQWIFGSVWCYLNAFFTILVTVASSATLAAIALDRYFAIVRPMQYSRKMTPSRANGLLIFAWCLGLVCALPPCFGWSSYEYHESHRACFLGWTSSLSYSIILLFITFCFPLVSMLVCYYAILKVARTKCKRINFGTMSEPPMTPLERIRTLTATTTSSAAAATSGIGTAELASMLGELTDPARSSAISDSLMSIGNNNNNNRSLRRQRFSFNGRKPSFSWLSSTSSINSTAPVKGMRTVFMVLAAFLLTWLPMLVLALLDMIQWLGGLGDWSPPQWLYIFAMWSMCAGSVTYPILYGIYNRAIRKELRLCLSCSGGIKNWRNNHFHGSQRRGSKWSNYSEYASLRPRELVSAAAAAAATAAVCCPQTGSSLVDSVIALGELARSAPMRRSSQDSGAVIPSDDEDGAAIAAVAALAAFRRSGSHSSSSGSSSRGGSDRAIPPSAAAAAVTWRKNSRQQATGGNKMINALHRPRMALAVLAVSLQHIAAHSGSHHHAVTDSKIEEELDPLPTSSPESPEPPPAPSDDDEEEEKRQIQQVQVQLESQSNCLDEGIEPDRRQ